MVEGAHKIWKRPNTPFYISYIHSVMFHVIHWHKGYDSADFFCETFSVIASDKGKRVIKGYETIRISITFYNLYNLVVYPSISMLDIGSSTIITYVDVSRETF